MRFDFACTISVVESSAKLQDIFVQSAAKKFEGVPGEKNLAIIFSADLMPSPAQATEDAMKQPPKIPYEQASWALAWAATVTDKSKLMLLCDGRNRYSRRILEDWVDQNYADATRWVDGLVHFNHMSRDADPRFS